MKRHHRALLLPWAGRDASYDYTAKVQALSPIAYWVMGEASGTVALDGSGNGRTGAYTGVTLGSAGIGDGRTAASFDGATSFNNVFGASFSTAFNGSKGTVAVWAKAASNGVWSDGVSRYLIDFLAADGSGNYRVTISKNTGATITLSYIANNINKAISVINNTGIAWMHWALTWDNTADQVKAYLNGVQQGATLTGLGVWNQVALFSTLTCVGAASTAPANVWNGLEAHAAVWNTALSAAQILTLATVP